VTGVRAAVSPVVGMRGADVASATALALGAAVLETLETMACTTVPVTPETRLEDLDIDSLDLVELTQVLEEEHGIAVPPLKDFEGLETVQQVFERIVALVDAAPVEA
jgi:acyl carrier protein